MHWLSFDLRCESGTYISLHAALMRYTHCHQCIYLVNLIHCIPNRYAHYIQKSSDFCVVLLLSSSLIIKQAVIVGLNSAKQPVIVGFNFSTLTVVCFLLL